MVNEAIKSNQRLHLKKKDRSFMNHIGDRYKEAKKIQKEMLKDEEMVSLSQVKISTREEHHTKLNMQEQLDYKYFSAA